MADKQMPVLDSKPRDDFSTLDQCIGFPNQIQIKSKSNPNQIQIKSKSNRNQIQIKIRFFCGFDLDLIYKSNTLLLIGRLDFIK